MPEIILVRHAHTAWSGHRYCGRSDPELSATGRRAAATVAAKLARLSPRDPRVVSSPALRSRQTAVAIGTAIGQRRLDVDPRWQEVNFGIAEGRTFDELATLAPGSAEQLLAGVVAIDWPGGELAVDFEARVLAAWTSAAAVGRTTIVVTHAGPIRLLQSLATGHPAPSIEVPAPASVLRLPSDFLGTRRAP